MFADELTKAMVGVLKAHGKGVVSFTFIAEAKDTRGSVEEVCFSLTGEQLAILNADKQVAAVAKTPEKPKPKALKVKAEEPKAEPKALPEPKAEEPKAEEPKADTKSKAKPKPKRKGQWINQGDFLGAAEYEFKVGWRPVVIVDEGIEEDDTEYWMVAMTVLTKRGLAVPPDFRKYRVEKSSPKIRNVVLVA